MKLVLKDNVPGVGDIGETVEVRNGFGRNYLVPRGLGLEVSSGNAKRIAHEMLQINARRRRMKVKAEDMAKAVRDLTLTFQVRVGTGGKVFGSVGPRDIAQKLTSLGFEVDRRRVLLSEPIKKVGVHFVTVKVHPEVTAQVKVVVEKLEATQAQERAETAEARAKIEEAALDAKQDA